MQINPMATTTSNRNIFSFLYLTFFAAAVPTRAQCLTTQYCMEKAALVPTLDSGSSVQEASDAFYRGDLAILVSSNKDQVSIFREIGGIWNEEDTVSVDRAAHVGTDGQRIIVGGGTTSTTGRVNILASNGSIWEVQQELIGSTSIDYGTAVAIEGDFAAVGASLADFGLSNSGAVYLYRYVGSSWVQSVILTATTQVSNARFGYSVALRGNVLAIGEPRSGGPTGRVHIYRHDGTNWVQEADLASPANGYQFGSSISLDDDLLLVSGDLGYIYRYDGLNWNLEGTLGSFLTGAKLVAIDDDVAVMGDLYRSCASGDWCGGAKIYQRLGGVWSETGFLKASDTRTGDLLGGAVGVQGTKVMAAVTGIAIPRRLPSGRAFIFDLADLAPDCDCDEVSDACEINSEGAPDCNGNGVPDDCDLADGTLHDADNDQIPDECPPILVQPPGPESDGFLKQRFISIEPGNPNVKAAMRVRAVSLNHPNPPYAGEAATSFVAYEGQTAWVGPPDMYPEDSVGAAYLHASFLTCVPYYRDWGNNLSCSGSPNTCRSVNDCPAGQNCTVTALPLDVLHITGSAIVPSSEYEVQLIAEGLDPLVESNYSPPIVVVTGRHGDVVAPFSPPSPTLQPDLTDLSAVIDKFRGLPSAPSKSRAKSAAGGGGNLAIGIVDLQFGLSFSDIAIAVDAFRGLGYRYNIGGHCTDNPLLPCEDDGDCDNSDSVCDPLRICP